jgi:hypothetical protein
MIGLSKSDQLRKNGTLKHKTMKPKTCKKCGETFTPDRPFQKACKYQCAIELAQAKAEKEKNKENSKAKKEFQQSDRKFLLELAQKTCNTYIRMRDGKHCISCGYDGSKQYVNDEYIGRKMDAGHFKSQGGNSSIRYDEANIHAQCVKCNRYESANLVPYREALIKKIGMDEVERLETTKNTKLWSVDELQEIIKVYKAKIKGLK